MASLKGSINKTEDKQISKHIEAFIPLKSLFGFTSNIRSQTQGRADSSMEFSHYEKVVGHRPKMKP